jgi:hypothetical protein
MAPGFITCLELAEDVLLDVQVLVDGLDHHVGLAEIGVAGGAADQPHALVDVGGGHAPAAHLDVVVAADHAETLVERFLVHLQHRSPEYRHWRSTW